MVKSHPHRREAAERRMKGEFKENSLEEIDTVRRASSVICKFNLRTIDSSSYTICARHSQGEKSIMN